MINDAHVHFFSPNFFDALGAQKGLPPDARSAQVARMLGWDDPVSADALADRWVAELDRQGVGRAAIIASVPGDEASVAAALARHPRRFVGFFMLDPTRDDARDRVTRAFEAGLRGICLFPAMHRYSIQDPRAVAIFELAQSCDLESEEPPLHSTLEHPRAEPGTNQPIGPSAEHAPVEPASNLPRRTRARPLMFVHCGVLSVGVRKKLGLASPFDVRFGNPLDLHALALRFPSLPIILPHFGAGMFREALMLVDLCPNVYLDSSSSNAWIGYTPPLSLADVFRAAIDVAGPDRLLFGTDSSFFPRGWHRAVWEHQLTAMRDADFSDAEQDSVLGGAFDKLFG